MELRFFNISNPVVPVEIDPYMISVIQGIKTLGVSGSVVYIGTYWEGSSLEVVNIANPSAPAFMGLWDGAGYTWDFAFSDQHLFSSRHRSGFDTFALCHGPLFADGFESGDTTAWSSAAP